MITTHDFVEDYIKNSNFLEEALGKGIINLSALARIISPIIEKKVMKKTKTGAIIMALRRLTYGINNKNTSNNLMRNLGDMTVRSNLTEFTFASSNTLFERQKQLFQKIVNQKEIVCNLSQGVFETTYIVTGIMEKTILEIFKGEKLLFKFNHLSSITIKLPVENITTPGVYYEILKALAWNNINIMEVISTSTEVILVFKNEDINRAFSVMNRRS